MRITRRRNTVCVPRDPSPPPIRSQRSPDLPADKSKTTPKPAARSIRATSVDAKKEETTTKAATRKIPPPKRPKTPVAPKKPSPKSKASAKVADVQSDEETNTRSLRRRQKSDDSETESEGDDGISKTILNDSLILKNTDKEMYIKNASTVLNCLLCEHRGNFITSHYSSAHPNAENYTARLPPQMGKLVRGKTKLDQAVPDVDKKFEQLCLFCNETLSKTHSNWVNHLFCHSGETTFRCNLCKRVSKKSDFDPEHNERCGRTHIKRVRIHLRDRTYNMLGYVCSLCNFTQFDKDCVTRHLANQHSKTEKNGKVLAVPFLRVPEKGAPRGSVPKTAKAIKANKLAADKKKALAKVKKLENAKKDKNKKKKKQIIFSSSESSNEEDEANEGEETSVVEAVKTVTKTEEIESESSGSERMPQLENEEKLYNSDAFVGRPKEVDCLFDKDTMQMMNDMSFNSGANPVTPPRPAATSIADKLNERFKSARKDSSAGNSDSPGSSIASSPRKLLSFDVNSSTVDPKNQQRLLSEFEIKNDDIPIVNQAVDGIEELSKSEVIKPIPVLTVVEDEDEWEDCSDEESIADDNEQMVITKEEPIADPLAVIKTSPKAPSTPSTTKTLTSPTTPQQTVVINKNMLIGDTVNRLYMSIKPAAIPKPISPPIAQPTPTIQPSSVAITIASQRVKTINRIDNLGFSVWNNVYAFCCLINECGYESNRANICQHILEHDQKWTGYCYMCDLQVSSN